MCNEPRFCEKGIVRSHKQVGPRLYSLCIHAPQTARTYQCGQFIHIQIPRMSDHILRRPFSVYRTDSAKDEIEILYQVVGAGTEHMTTLKVGETLDVLGVMGVSWLNGVASCGDTQIALGDATRVCVVAGGLGAAPLYLLTESLASRGVLKNVVLGAQTRGHLITEDAYRALVDACGASIHFTTDDGSFGTQGFVTLPLEEILKAGECDLVVCCGPEPAMRAVYKVCATHQMPLLVSMEKRMACGIGVCLSCVVPTTCGLKRSCVDGPIFDAAKVVW